MRTADLTKFQIAKETETAIYINCYTAFGDKACWSLVRVPRTEIHNGIITTDFVAKKQIIVTR